MNLKGNIILFPCPIADGNISSLSAESVQLLHETTCFVVEKAKTARHFIKATNHPIPISQLEILEISDDKKEMEDFLAQHLTEKYIGIISEAGCPGIADPGADVVAWAHKNQVRVIPQAGPSSIFMAMMSSGMNGQNFAFNGYLSNKKPELIQQLKALEQKFQKKIETPQIKKEVSKKIEYNQKIDIEKSKEFHEKAISLNKKKKKSKEQLKIVTDFLKEYK